jgi:CspA family cold shock protein
LKEEIMARGKVKWFNAKKGYGFISTNEGKDVFVHYNEIQSEGFKTLEEGDDVEFEVNTGPKGDHATNVVVVKV